MQCFDESILPKPSQPPGEAVRNDYACPICAKHSTAYFVDGLCVDILREAPHAENVYINTDDGTWSLGYGGGQVPEATPASSGDESDGYESIMRNRAQSTPLNQAEVGDVLDATDQPWRREIVHIGSEDEPQPTRRRFDGSTVYDAIILD
jgi:hypothetical protein